GDYYLNKSGPYEEFFPEVLRLSEGNYWVDYAYHLAPINRFHIDEMPLLLERHGVSSFKIFMFYGGHGLHGRSANQRNFLHLQEGESYDLAHFEFIMRKLSEMLEAYPDRADAISLSLHCELARFELMMRRPSAALEAYRDGADATSLRLHCEVADILNACAAMVERGGKLQGLRAYHAARPPHSEGLAVFIAAYLAYETGA